jgi:hypothetical protein
MTTIVASDILCIQLFVIIYVALINGNQFCILKPNERCEYTQSNHKINLMPIFDAQSENIKRVFKLNNLSRLTLILGFDRPGSCFITLYFNNKTMVTFFVNFSAAVNTWQVIKI